MYNKGAWVLHMLRWEVGDSSFFNILRTYYDTYKYSNASISDFKHVSENISDKNLDKFFEQWVYGKGLIELEYQTEIKNTAEGYLVRIWLEQIQENYDEYHFPLEVQISSDDSSSKSYRYEIVSGDTLLEMITLNYPDRIKLDPNNWLLAVLTSIDE